jgi:anti-sigma regulatory factor (Ser/Thr protein kinase)
MRQGGRNMTEKRFRKNIASLDEVFAFLEEEFGRHGPDPAAAYALTLAVEEFFTNFVKYNPESERDVTVGVGLEGDALAVRLVADDVNSFDVTATGPVDVSLSLEDRTPGGLGIHLSRHMLDDVRYEYADRRSTITLIKRLRT